MDGFSARLYLSAAWLDASPYGLPFYKAIGFVPADKEKGGGVDMAEDKIFIQDAPELDPNLLRMLDRGLEEIEAGRTF